MFSNAAIRKIVKAANGIPRNLNMLCTDALVAGCRRRKRPIPASIVKQVLADFQVPRSRRTARFAWLAIAVVLVATLAAGVAFRDALPGYVHQVSAWPRQVIDQVSPLLADLTQKAASWSSSAPKPMAVSTPVAAPPAVDRPASEAVVPSPPQTMVEAPQLPPSRVRVEVETALPPLRSHLKQVASLVDQHFPQGGAFGLKVWRDKAPGQAYVEHENLILYVQSETSCAV